MPRGPIRAQPSTVHDLVPPALVVEHAGHALRAQALWQWHTNNADEWAVADEITVENIVYTQGEL